MSDAVTFESSGDVAIVRIDDGKANALSPAVLKSIHTALDQAEEGGHALLLVGRPGRFSAGFDLNVIRDGGPEASRALVESGARLALRLARFPAPVVIGCTGHALAMGAVLLMTADTRVGTSGDFKIGFNEVAIGMTTPDFLVEFARQRLSKRHFMRAVVQAEIYDPASAVDAGFLDAVTSADSILDEGLREAARLAKLPRTAYVQSRASASRAALEMLESTL